MTRPRIAVVFGTRPEAIKLAPVVLALRADARLETLVCVTGQHRTMLDQTLDTFSIAPDADLNVMQPGQTLAGLTARAITQLDEFLLECRPNLLLVQGDTTTAFAAALTAFYHKVPLGHVEAGLRTRDIMNPWPEEANRELITRLAALHFAPTDAMRCNLEREGVSSERIHVTGNTVVDALLLTVTQVKLNPPIIPGFRPDHRRLVLITGHRRESFGCGMEAICHAIADLALRFPDVRFVYPVHLNPNVREPVTRILHGTNLHNVNLLEPLPYREFISLFLQATLVLSDSGGIQEEAPSLGKPVLLLRDTTERPEAIECGTVKLVGTRRETIVSETTRLLTDAAQLETMSRVSNPFGDGHAAERIAAVCTKFVMA
jgi:UDP-N-acetylglucosamine 2-epimerase (non-hydrolysing)